MSEWKSISDPAFKQKVIDLLLESKKEHQQFEWVDSIFV